MALVEFSKRDLAFGKVIDPAWYRVRIDNVGEAPAKDSGKGPSTNYPVEATILFNGDTGDMQYSEFPIRWNFNSKAIGNAVGFLQAMGVEVTAGVRFDLAAAEGRIVDVYVENGDYQGRVVNQVNHKYRTPKEDVKAAS